MTRKLALTLLALLTIFISGLTNKAEAAAPHEIKDIIVKTAISMGVDPCVALSIAQQESNFQAHKQNSSGAVGVFQLMPSTARRIGVNPYNLNENVKGGILYYQMMYKKFGSMDLALAAYNAGPGNVAKYNGIPPFSETKKFINTIKSNCKLFENDPAVIKHLAVKEEPKQLPAAEVTPPPVKEKTEKVEAAVEVKKEDDSNSIIVPDITL